MKIGIISDLHDNLRHLDLVAAELKKLGIELLIFCGDFDSPFSMRGFLQFHCPVKAILGNADPDIQKFQYQLQNLEVLKPLELDIKHRFQDFTQDNCRIGVIHNDDKALTQALIDSQLYDLLCIGHTHTAEIKSQGKTTIVNPGSLVGWKLEQGGAVAITYASFDTITKEAKLYQI